MNILIIAPHMDDEVLGCGGVIAKHTADGDNVSVCVIANRAYGHKYDSELINKQKTHALAAKAILGYKDLTFLDLPDEQLDSKTLDVLVPLESYIKVIKPEVVYMNHRGDSNQDHKAVFKAAVIACRSFGIESIKKILCYEVLSSTEQSPALPETMFMPNYYIDISRYIDKKKKALECYTDELRSFPHPRSIEGIEILAKKRGMEIGYKYAEAFCLIRQKVD